MFKSIFTKLLTTYLVIIVAIISIISLILSYVYSDNVFKEKERAFKIIADRVEGTISDYYANKVAKEELDAVINTMGYVEDARIYALRLDKESLKHPETFASSSGLSDSSLLSDLNRILDGSTIFKRNQYTKAFDTTMVFFGTPLMVSGRQEGVILIFSPVSQIASNITKMNLIIWVTALIAILTSSIVIFFNSRRISRPIKIMDVAAKSIASGENTQDLEITSKDEVGQLAQTFNYMKNRIMETETIRREFIANVSHDLRTPLTTINGFVEALIDGIIDPGEYEKYFKIINEETTRLMKMTDEILQLSKLQSGVYKLSKSPIRVYPLLLDLTDAMVMGHPGKTVSFDVDCPQDFIVYADHDRLKQILINIINNAVKYSREHVDINIKVWESEGRSFFSVKDNGIGIDAEAMKYIFEKFYRVEKSGDTRLGGTGLGLSIVKVLVELHGGDIRVESEPDKGTEVTFWIAL